MRLPVIIKTASTQPVRNFDAFEETLRLSDSPGGLARALSDKNTPPEVKNEIINNYFMDDDPELRSAIYNSLDESPKLRDTMVNMGVVPGHPLYRDEHKRLPSTRKGTAQLIAGLALPAAGIGATPYMARMSSKGKASPLLLGYSLLGGALGAWGGKAIANSLANEFPKDESEYNPQTGNIYGKSPVTKTATSPKAIHDAAWGRILDIGNHVDNLVGPKWYNKLTHGANLEKRIESTKAMIDETASQLRGMRDLSLNKVTQDKQYSAGSNTSVIDSLMNQLSKYKEQLNGVAPLKKSAMPTIIKVAVSPSKIYAAGLKRLNNLNREAMLLRMPRPSQTIGSGVHGVVTDGKKELLSKVNKSIRQVGNIGEASFKRDRRYGGREFTRASDATMKGLTELKDRIK